MSLDKEYIFVEGKDSPYNNISQVPELIHDIPKMKLKCNTVPNCVGFNTEGWLKSKILPKELWLTTNSEEGLFYLSSLQNEPKKYDPPENYNERILIPPNIISEEEKKLLHDNKIRQTIKIKQSTWKRIFKIYIILMCVLIILSLLIKFIL